MIERSKAQRAAEARYDAKRRGVTITLRLSRAQAAWLDAKCIVGESRQGALRRLAKMPDMPPNGEVRGASRPAGEASSREAATSTVVLERKEAE